MTVADLQSFVRNLGATLANAGAKKPADDLERIAVGLQPFHSLGLAQFSDFLIAAENYARSGIVPMSGKGRAKAAAPKADSAERIRLAIERVNALYDRATSPELQYIAIDAEIKAIDKQLTKEEAVQVARQTGIAASLKTKKAAIDEIKRKVIERKESFERIQFRSGEAQSAPP